MKREWGKRRSLRREIVHNDDRSSFTCKEETVADGPFHWHFHPEVEINLVLQGSGMRLIGDSIEPFQDGDLCLIGPDLPHACPRPDPGRPMHTIVIQFPPAIWDAAFMNLPEMAGVRRLLDSTRMGLQVVGEARGRATEAVHAIAALPPGSSRRAAELLSLLSLLADAKAGRALSSGNVKRPEGKDENRKINQIFTLIHDMLPDALTESEIAERVGLTAGAFSHFFKRSSGKSYLNYTAELRIGLACRHLLDGGKSIAEVAWEAGFNNMSNFHRQFRKLKGVTPKAYRNCVQGEFPAGTGDAAYAPSLEARFA